MPRSVTACFTSSWQLIAGHVYHEDTKGNEEHEVFQSKSFVAFVNLRAFVIRSREIRFNEMKAGRRVVRPVSAVYRLGTTQPGPGYGTPLTVPPFEYSGWTQNPPRVIL